MYGFAQQTINIISITLGSAKAIADNQNQNCYISIHFYAFY
jgi:hypothetical protein